MLPPLREELSLYAGPATITGEPTWSLHDPVRNAYFRIDWVTFEILSRWHLPDPQEIVRAVSVETPIQGLEPSDIQIVLRFLSERELLQRSDAAFSRSLAGQVQRQKSNLWTWLLHRYLFFRLPLWKPDAWLGRTHHLVRVFYSPLFFGLSGLALMVGLLQVSRQSDSFSTTLVDLFSWHGLLAYALTLVLVKFAHELGHAFTAKRLGCRVPIMGVAFLVMFPMAYTDVNDAWKLPQRRHRLAVGAAGIITELLIAIWATLAWVLLPDGLLRTSMFLLASTTWIATLLINASPFLRFDGYFLMMDWLDMPNLHARAFALGRWRLREWLFGLEVPPPEQMGSRRQRLLILFAYATWGYRLLVFGGIAVIVYQAFPKPLGPVLAAIEVSWFIILPVLHEMKIWREYLSNLLRTRPGQRTLGVLVCLLLVVIVPWDTRVEGQGVLKPLESYPLIAPGGARISTMPVSNGAAVPAQALLLILEQVDLQFQHRALVARSAGLSWQVSAAGVDAKLREQQQVIAAKREKVNAEQQGLEKQQRQFVMRAPFAGTFYLTHPDLVAGNWVGKNEKLGELVGSASLRVETYLAEADIDRLRVGDQGVFYPEPGSPGSLKLVVNNIDTDATHELTEGMLASSRGGGIAVREHAKALVPEQALYRVVLSVQAGENSLLLPVLRGRVVIHGKAQNSLVRYVRAGLAVLWREAGF